MTKILKSDDRGHVNLGWLDSYHSFSFGDYYHPERMGFRALRVINEDSIADRQWRKFGKERRHGNQWCGAAGATGRNS